MLDKFFKDNDYKVDWVYLDTIPEFAKLKDCEQNPKWHSEGDAYAHTVKCVEAAYALLLEEEFIDLEPRIAVAAVLFHDIGKCRTTEFKNGAWHAYGHEFASEKIARRILWEESIGVRELICSCARHHMNVLRLVNSKTIADDMIRMTYNYAFYWKYLLFTKLCDCTGSEPEDETQFFADVKKIGSLYEIANALGILDGQLNVNLTSSRRMVLGKKVRWEDSIDSDAIKVYVPIGLPGSGKNTYFDKWYSTNVEQISRDDIRAELGYCKEGDKVVLPKEDEDRVTEEFNRRVVAAINIGKSVYLNNLNIKKAYRDAYKTLLAGKNVEWIYIYIEAPSIKDNIKRRPMFEPDVLKEMRERIDWPQREEYDELIVIR